jgi:hypothetical protein
MHRDRAGSLAEDGIDEQSQAGNMVEVAMREEDMVYPYKLSDIQVGYSCSGVEQDVVVQQKTRRKPLMSADSAGTAQHLQLHLAESAMDTDECPAICSPREIFRLIVDRNRP